MKGDKGTGTAVRRRGGKAALLLLYVLLAGSLAAQQPATYTYALKASDKAKLERAVEEYHKGHYGPSAEALRKLSKQHPDDPDIYFYLGMNAVKKNFNTAAIRRYFTKVIELNPDYPDAVAHYYMGVIHYTDNQFAEAESDFTRYFERANRQGTASSDELYMEASSYLQWSRFLADAYRNMAPFSPTVMDRVSSAEDELLPYVTCDGKDLFFLRYIPVNSRKTFYAQEMADKELRLFYSHRTDSLFSAPRMLPAPFNQGDPEGGVTLTASGDELYYSVIRKVHGYKNSDIYCTRRKGLGQWSPVENVGDSVNDATTWESQPSVTPDGQWLYFASNRPGGLGGTDLWRCHRKADGSWGRPQNLGSSINTPGNEKSPFIHADGHTLYFASDGWQGFGGYDMYFYDLAQDTMAIPTNLGLPLNTEGDDFSFGIMPDGRKAYYAGYPPDYGGKGGTDILMFDLYATAQPEGMYLYRGSVATAQGTPAAAVITVRHGKETLGVYRTDNEGNFSIMLSASRSNSVTVEAAGYRTEMLTVPPETQKTTPLPAVVILQKQSSR